MKYIILRATKLTVTSVFVMLLAACGGAEDRKEKYLEKGRVYLEEKNYSKAKIEFKNVLQIDPKFADAYFYMALLDEENKEIRKAIGNYRKAIELNPEYTDAKIKLARIYVIAGSSDLIDEAKKLLNEIERSSPSLAEVELIAVTIEYKTGDKVKGKKALEALVKRAPDTAEGVSLLASIYISEGEDDKAADLLIKGADKNVDNIPMRIMLAKLLAKNKKITESAKYLDQAINIAPENFSIRVALSGLYASTNQIEKAEAVLRKAIEEDDEDVQRYVHLVHLLSVNVSIKKADDELKAAIAAKPDLYRLRFAQVEFYKNTGRRAEAKSLLKQIIVEKSYDNEGVDARNELAKLFLQDGDIQSAIQYVDEVLAEYPSNNDALLLKSRYALASRDVVSAINNLRIVTKNDPKNAEASFLLAQAHDLNNESSLAENELKKAIGSDPVNYQVHANYANFLGSKGRMDEAVKIVDKALTYFKDSYDLMDIKLKILTSQGKEAEVLSLLNVMEQIDTTKYEVNIRRGNYYLAKREILKAVDQFEIAYLKSADKYVPLQLIVKAYMQNNQPEEALNRLQKNIDADPNDAVALLLTGHVYLTQKKIPEARNKFSQASKISKSWFPPYSSLVTSYLLENNSDKAIAVYQEAISNLKNKVPAQLKLAGIYEQVKNFTAAISVYQDILLVNKANLIAANNYASLLLDYGSESDIPKALELVKGFELIQKPELQDTLAWAYVKSGNSNRAIKILKPIVDKLPDVAVFRYHLGYALYQIGDKAAAKSNLDVAVSSEQNFTGKDNAKELLKTI